MRKILSILVLAALLFSQAKAHTSYETYADFTLESGHMKVRLEMPWTISEAVMAAYPQSKRVEKAEFRAYVDRYIHEFFVVERGGEEVQWTTLKDVPAEESHSAIVDIWYPLEGMEGITGTNRVLFKLTRGPENHHRLALEGGKSMEITTTVETPSFEVEDATTPAWSWWLIGGCGLGLIGMVLAFRSPPKSE